MDRELDYKVPNGKLIRIKAELDNNTINTIKITGDFFLYPEDKLSSLEETLSGHLLNPVTLQKTIESALESCEMVGISPKEITNALMMLHSD